MKTEELKKLLETPLDPNLDYFDATASLKAMAEHIRDLHKLLNFFFETLGLQGRSILDIREKMIGHKEAIEQLADLLGGEKPAGLVGFDEPAIFMPRKPN